MAINYEWRGAFNGADLEALYAEAFDHKRGDHDWKGQVERHSLGWVCATEGDDLVGFVNVGWDGASHAFLLDTLVTSRVRHQGVGKRLVQIAVKEAHAAGCEWLHVDFDDQLGPFYFDACGFVSTTAGLLDLKRGSEGRPSPT